MSQKRVNKRSHPRSRSHSESVESRTERKARTRAALLESALEQLEESSFAALSLRDVARGAGVVPTAFYRHFENMEELGLALIEESFRTLRAMIRDARSDPDPEHIIERSVATLVRHVREHRAHFRFIARERAGGIAAMRIAIRAEIRLFSSELATDLARFPVLNQWSTEDLGVLASVLVDSMVAIVESLIDAPPGDSKAEADVIRIAQKKLRMVVLGIPNWRSSN